MKDARNGRKSDREIRGGLNLKLIGSDSDFFFGWFQDVRVIRNEIFAVSFLIFSSQGGLSRGNIATESSLNI